MTHTELERPTPDLREPRPMTHARLDAPTTYDGAITHGEDRENNWAWSGGLRWHVMVVACIGAYDSGFGHGGLVMVFMSTMGFRFEEGRA